MRHMANEERRGEERGQGGRPDSESRRPKVITGVLVVALVCLVACFVGIGAGTIGTSGEDAETPAAAETGEPSRRDVELSDSEDETVTVDIMMVGDVLGHQGVMESGVADDGTRNYDHLFAHVSDDAQAADIAILNQESQLGGTQLGLTGYPQFNSPQEFGDAEVKAGFDTIASATNHTVDYGNEAVASELEFWRTKHPDVMVLGIADSQETYDEIHVYEKDGFRIALLNYTFGTNGLPIPEDNPYAVKMLEQAIVADELARANEMADMVVVLPHWGTEYSDVATDNQRNWAQFFCDNGADVIIGTHPHCLEPVETIESADGHRTLCFWSIGNFVSCQKGVQKATGGMAKVRLVKDGTGCYIASWELDPLVCHIASGTSFTVYKLSDYNDDLAADNGASVGSVRAIQDHCSDVLGDGYDQSSFRLAGGEIRSDGETLAQAA